MCSTYLAFFMRDDLLDEMPMYPYPDAPSGGGSGGDSSAEIFMAPSVTFTYDQVGNMGCHVSLISCGETSFRADHLLVRCGSLGRTEDTVEGWVWNSWRAK